MGGDAGLRPQRPPCGGSGADARGRLMDVAPGRLMPAGSPVGSQVGSGATCWRSRAQW